MNKDQHVRIFIYWHKKLNITLLDEMKKRQKSKVYYDLIYNLPLFIRLGKNPLTTVVEKVDYQTTFT